MDNNEEKEFMGQGEVGQKIVPVELPSKDIGIDVDNQLMQNIVSAGLSSKLDLNAIESLTNVSRSRDTICDVIDMMMQDSTMASILESLVEDTVETSDSGRIIWAECDDPDTAKFIDYLLDTINVDKHIASWAYCLIKYGDVYLKLFRQSDEEKADPEEKTQKDILNESVVAQAHNVNDKYTGYVEMVRNPAEVFELVKLGKTRGYIKTDIEDYSKQFNNEDSAITAYYQMYKFNGRDVEVYAADDFVHGFLEDNSGRAEEKINIFYDDYDTDGEKTDTSGYSFKVRRGQSLFYNVFKAWRDLSLIENSIMLNRVTKSAIVRIINVQVGDMPKEMIGFRFDTLHKNFSHSGLTAGYKDLGEGKTPEDYKNYLNDISKDDNLPPFIVITPKDLGGKRLDVPTLEGLIEQYKPDIVGLDQLSLMEDARQSKGQQERIRFTHVSEDLYNCSEKYGIPILTPSQATRSSVKKKGEEEDEETPDLHEISESDGIGQNATRVIGMKQIGNTLKLTVRKSRYSKRGGEILVLWDIDKGIIKPFMQVNKDSNNNITSTVPTQSSELAGVELF